MHLPTDAANDDVYAQGCDDGQGQALTRALSDVYEREFCTLMQGKTMVLFKALTAKNYNVAAIAATCHEVSAECNDAQQAFSAKKAKIKESFGLDLSEQEIHEIETACLFLLAKNYFRGALIEDMVSPRSAQTNVVRLGTSQSKLAECRTNLKELLCEVSGLGDQQASQLVRTFEVKLRGEFQRISEHGVQCHTISARSSRSP